MAGVSGDVTSRREADPLCGSRADEGIGSRTSRLPREEVLERQAAGWHSGRRMGWAASGLRSARAVTEDTRLVRAECLARPEGVGRALATYRIPIEGRDEWLAAATRLA